MISQTLAQGLRKYAIGPKLRALRLRKKLSLVELGRHTGLSAAMLSKLERGKLFPTLPTLLRIGLVYGVGLDEFFAAEDQRRVGVVRRADRLRFSDRWGGREPVYEFECLDFTAIDRRASAFWARFRPARRVRRHTHAESEFVYVLKGKLAVVFDDHEVALDAGDSMYFDGARPHGYRRVGAGACEGLVVTVP